MVDKEEKELLEAAEILSGLLGNAGWRVYREQLEKLIVVRQRLLETQLADLSVGGDFATRVAYLETIKGAINGLRLALSFPSSIIEQADEIRQALARKEELEKETSDG